MSINCLSSCFVGIYMCSTLEDFISVYNMMNDVTANSFDFYHFSKNSLFKVSKSKSL